MLLKVAIIVLIIYIIVVTRSRIRLPNPALQATVDVLQAATLKDEHVIQMARKYIDYADAQNALLPVDDPYAERLDRLTSRYVAVNGVPLNFRVYKTAQINAFATADGSIRIFSGLMDLMNDDELMAIIGHEIGHVARTDTKDALKNAYLRSAAQNAPGSVSGSVAARLSESQLAELANSLAQAQYSQKQEYDADEYGFEFCLKNNVDPYAMYHALDKLADMSKTNRNNASAIVKAFATHPDSYKRAQRMKEKADALQH